MNIFNNKLLRTLVQMACRNLLCEARLSHILMNLFTQTLYGSLLRCLRLLFLTQLLTVFLTKASELKFSDSWHISVSQSRQHDFTHLGVLVTTSVVFCASVVWHFCTCMSLQIIVCWLNDNPAEQLGFIVLFWSQNMVSWLNGHPATQLRFRMLFWAQTMESWLTQPNNWDLYFDHESWSIQPSNCRVFQWIFRQCSIFRGSIWVDCNCNWIRCWRKLLRHRN